MIGKTILHYKILSKIGEGGMGVVYKAEDTKLKREVALKFLPSNALQGKAEKERFTREAQAAAGLNHANIAHIYAIEELDDQIFISMEYIDGQSLSEKVGASRPDRTPLRLEDAITYATQIASGLQVAHKKGIIHRDIKSANIMITEEGVVKIMDFGLAKVANRSMMTQEGTALGTAAYMSPEQSRGEKVDHRSDIWSLGVILYEMITGQLPFKGEYESAVIYSIQNEEPEPLTALRSGVPIALDGIIAKSLSKDPVTRYQNVEELPADLQALETASLSQSRISTKGTSIKSSKPARGSKLPWALFGIALLTTVLAFVAPWRKSPAPKRPNKTVLTLPNMSLTSRTTNRLAISPDGMDMVFVAYEVLGASGSRLFLKRADGFDVTQLPGRGGDAPFFSLDGRWIGYINPRSQEINKVLVDGGEPFKITNYNANLGGATWAPDNTIIYVDDGVLKRIPDSGGEPAALTEKKDANEQHLFPHILPDGKAILFTIGFADAELSTYRLAVYRFGDDDYRVILDEDGYNSVYSNSGHILYARSGDLMAAPFDLKNLQITGVPTPAIENVEADLSGAMSYAMSQAGTIIYAMETESNSQRSVLKVDMSGNATEFFDLKKGFELARYSPDGKYVAFVIREQNIPNIWMYHIEGGSLNQLTFYQGDGVEAMDWSPDSKSIAYATKSEDSTNSIYTKQVDGSGKAQKVFTSPLNEELFVWDWSRDGKTILAVEWRPISDHDLFVYSFKDSSAQSYLSTRAHEENPEFSPNGFWIAYRRDSDIYVRPYPESSGGLWKISNIGGNQPVWSPDGKKIFYRHESTMYAVDVTTSGVFSKGNPKKIFEGNFFLRGYRKFDIHPDGRSFIMIQPAADPQDQKIFVIQNFDEELKRLAPRGKD